uniref:EGF-like domain-containing protein n=1 Tax=Timema genevievae TaxID=629358 RepID=A0A7R9JVX7_TIMGE|nr:unnamed protein product [Timema genevievae]
MQQVAVCCLNLLLHALSSRSALPLPVGTLFQKFVTCRSVVNGEFICSCLPGFYGEDCSLYNPCNSEKNPCYNGGLKTDMESRFEDLTKLQIPDWILDPFSFEAVDKLDNSLQTEFLDLKYDCEAKIIFKQSGYDDVSHSFSCKCQEGYHGITCQAYDPCSQSPCQNNAHCINISNSSYQCLCEAGYTGENCEVNINECASNLCENNASCIDGIEAYSCDCPLGYEGVTQLGFLERPIKPEEFIHKTTYRGSNKSLHQSILVYVQMCKDELWITKWPKLIMILVLSLTLTESKGYLLFVAIVIFYNTLLLFVWTSNYECSERDFCEHETNECFSRPCMNGGTCSDSFNQYFCSCPLGYSGDNCEHDIEQCPSETMETDRGSFKWLAIDHGLVAIIPCPYGTYRNDSTNLSEDIAQALSYAQNTLEPRDPTSNKPIANKHYKRHSKTASSGMKKFGDEEYYRSTKPYNTSLNLETISYLMEYDKEGIGYAIRICIIDDLGLVKWTEINTKACMDERSSIADELRIGLEQMTKDPSQIDAKMFVNATKQVKLILEYALNNIKDASINIPGEALLLASKRMTQEWLQDGIIIVNHSDLVVSCESTHMTAFSVLLDPSPNEPLPANHEFILTIISYIGSTLRLPVIIVSSTVIYDIAFYQSVESKYCFIRPRDQLVYNITYFGPACCLLAINVVVFVLVARVLFRNKMAGKMGSNSESGITMAQIRGAFTVMTLLGVTWTFGAFAFGELNAVRNSRHPDGSLCLLALNRSLTNYTIFDPRRLQGDTLLRAHAMHRTQQRITESAPVPINAPELEDGGGISSFNNAVYTSP